MAVATTAVRSFVRKKKEEEERERQQINNENYNTQGTNQWETKRVLDNTQRSIA